jgi:hypothetical protein
LIVIALIGLLMGAMIYGNIGNVEDEEDAPENGWVTTSPRRWDFNLTELPWNETRYSWEKIEPLDPYEPADENGVFMLERDGELHYFPTQMCQRVLHMLDAYRRTNETEYLNRSITFTDKLIDLCVEDNGSLFPEYSFDFHLHGDTSKTLSPPWVCGMGQGMALSVLTRMYWITGDEMYLKVAHSIFIPFTRPRTNDSDDRWICSIDDQGYYWIEEFPYGDGTHALNGFIFALFGLYDYWLETRNETCKAWLEAGLTTIHHYLPDFRCEGGVSYYCLMHKVQIDRYHKLHVKQLIILYRMTGHEYFQTMKDLFLEDFSDFEL